VKLQSRSQFDVTRNTTVIQKKAPGVPGPPVVSNKGETLEGPESSLGVRYYPKAETRQGADRVSAPTRR
jgi:hypothetical protein